MGPGGWSVVAAVAALAIGAIDLWLLRAIRAGSLRRNQFVGIRTARTMRDDESWQVAHEASIPSLRWSIALSVLSAVAVLALREPLVSALALLLPIAPMIVGGVQGQSAARRRQQR